jgi:ribonuclease VapC
VIIDTSALVAIFFNEPERDEFTKLILRTEVCRISVVSMVELAMVQQRLANPDAPSYTDRFLKGAGVTQEPVTLAQGSLARQAFYDFGRGRHRAKLNFGDCFSYALAKAMDEPLLFKGNDFSETDLASARG